MCGSFERSLSFDSTRLLTINGYIFSGIFSAIRSQRSQARLARCTETTQNGGRSIELDHVHKGMSIQCGHKAMQSDCAGDAMPQPNEDQAGELGDSIS